MLTMSVAMLYKELIEHFGGLSKAARALDFSKQTVHGWGKRGSIPFEAQFRIQLKTKGMFTASLKELSKKNGKKNGRRARR